METIAAYVSRIRECFPNLSISRVDVNSEGVMNDVIIVNQERVFRFPKYEWAKESLVHEAEILELAGNYVEMRIPMFDHREDDFVTYKLIPGVALHRNDLFGQDEHVRDRLAEQLATFLRQLHAIPKDELERHSIRQSVVMRSYDDWSQLFDDIQRELFPLMIAHSKDWVVRHFEPFLKDRKRMNYRPALINGDLEPSHILYDQTERRINGVIDFGSAGMGDPAVDFACILYFLGEAFVQRMGKFYPEIVTAIDRARFWAEAFELQWALEGVRSKDLSWFLVHIGSA